MKKEELKGMTRDELEHLLIKMSEFYKGLDDYLCEQIGKERYVKYLNDFTNKKILRDIKNWAKDIVEWEELVKEGEDLN